MTESLFVCAPWRGRRWNICTDLDAFRRYPKPRVRRLRARFWRWPLVSVGFSVPLPTSLIAQRKVWYVQKWAQSADKRTMDGTVCFLFTHTAHTRRTRRERMNCEYMCLLDDDGPGWCKRCVMVRVSCLWRDGGGRVFEEFVFDVLFVVTATCFVLEN